MIFYPIIWLSTAIANIIYGLFATITNAIPTSFFTTLNYVFAIPRMMNGLFPIMITLTQAFIVIFYAWIISVLWRFINTLTSYIPLEFMGTGRLPNETIRDGTKK